MYSWVSSMIAPPEPVLSDEQLKEFITNNITNPGVLYKYFANSTRPLSALILTHTISRAHDPYLGEQAYNFLGYAGHRAIKLFRHLVRLAEPNAINAALAQDALNNASKTTLHVILEMQTFFKKENVGILIEKASREVIAAASIKEFQGENPFSIALHQADESVVCALIKNNSPKTVNDLAMKMYAGRTILDIIVQSILARGTYTQSVIDVLITQLEKETIDFLVSTPDINGTSPLNHLLYAQKRLKSANDLIICNLVARMSQKAIDEIAKKKGTHTHPDLITTLALNRSSPMVVHAILSRLDKELLEKVVLSGGEYGLSPLLLSSFTRDNRVIVPSLDITKATNPALATIIQFLSIEARYKLLQSPVNIHEFNKSPAAHMVKLLTNRARRQVARVEAMKGNTSLAENKNDNRQISNEELALAMPTIFLGILTSNTPALNQLFAKPLSDGESLQLSLKVLYRLSADNLFNYLAQHPEISMEKFENKYAYSKFVNWAYKPGFDKRLHQANARLQYEVNTLLTMYHALYNGCLLEPIKKIIFDYLILNQAISHRLDYTIIAENSPNQIMELSMACTDIDSMFPQFLEFKCKYNATKIVVEYLADHRFIANQAFEKFSLEQKQRKMQEIIRPDPIMRKGLLSSLPAFFNNQEVKIHIEQEQQSTVSMTLSSTPMPDTDDVTEECEGEDEELAIAISLSLR